MTRIITLLNEKNHYLENFYSLNESELKNFLDARFEGLEAFYNSREKILEIIKYIDAQIDKEQLKEQTQPIPEKQRIEVKRALLIKEQYVEKILEKDLEILSCIESAKNGLLRELQSVRRGRKAVGGYKSKPHAHRLDEEA